MAPQLKWLYLCFSAHQRLFTCYLQENCTTCSRVRHFWNFVVSWGFLWVNFHTLSVHILFLLCWKIWRNCMIINLKICSCDDSSKHSAFMIVSGWSLVNAFPISSPPLANPPRKAYRMLASWVMFIYKTHLTANGLKLIGGEDKVSHRVICHPAPARCYFFKAVLLLMTSMLEMWSLWTKSRPMVSETDCTWAVLENSRMWKISFHRAEFAPSTLPLATLLCYQVRNQIQINILTHQNF